jgi:hypothetical protein
MTGTQLNRDELLAAFCAKFQITELATLRQIDHYNFQYKSYGNEIYELPSTRLAHWRNYEEGNWFAKRIDLYLDRVEALRDVLLIDIGFSIPYLSTRASLLGRNDISAILVDNKQSAADFYSFVQASIASPRSINDHVLVADVEDSDGQRQVVDVAKHMIAKHNTKHVLIAASEVVEHLRDPSNFWNFASLLSKAVSVETTIYVTLPVADPIPSHSLVFEQEVPAMTYLLKSFELDEALILRPPSPTNGDTPIHRGCICAFGRMT